MAKKLFSLLSGGIDSTLATIARIKQKDFVEFQPIFIDYGQKAKEQEWKAVCRISKEIALLMSDVTIRAREPKFITLSSKCEKANQVFGWSKSELIEGNTGDNPYLENRNMVLLSIAASFVESKIGKAEVGVIVTGFRNEYPDTQKEFVSRLNDLFAYLLRDEEKTIIIEAPIICYGDEGKKELVADFKDFKRIIDLTWSCYEPKEGKPCGKCDACKKRKRALSALEFSH